MKLSKSLGLKRLSVVAGIGTSLVSELVILINTYFTSYEEMWITLGIGLSTGLFVFALMRSVFWLSDWIVSGFAADKGVSEVSKASKGR